MKKILKKALFVKINQLKKKKILEIMFLLGRNAHLSLKQSNVLWRTKTKQKEICVFITI